MERQEVTSSQIHSIGYDPKAKVLEVEFNRGPVYDYYGVSPARYRQLMAASSHGTYFNEKIRGTYDYRRVEG